MNDAATPVARERRSTHGPSFLRWAGSKRQTLASLRGLVPTNERHYVEPFAGSAALFFATKPNRATLADLNGHLVNTLAHVRESPKSIHSAVASIPRDEDSYYSSRTRFNLLSPDSEEAAALFVYLNRNCFNGLWRTNSKGFFNVPYGGQEMGTLPPLELFIDCAAALEGADLVHQDYRRTLEGLDSRHFIYADPPYFTAKERTFVEYGSKSFGQADLEDLVVLLVAAASRGARVALTYSEAMPIVGIPESWVQSRFEVTRNVGGFSGSRKKHGEVLYYSSAE